MIAQILNEIINADRNNRARAEAAVTRLYEALRLNRPTIHWVSSIRAGFELAAQWKTDDADETPWCLCKGVTRAFQQINEIARQHTPERGAQDPDPIYHPATWPKCFAPEIELALVAREMIPMSPRDYHRALVGGYDHNGCFQYSKRALGWSIPRVSSYGGEIHQKAVLVEATSRLSASRCRTMARRLARAIVGVIRDTHWVLLNANHAFIAQPPQFVRRDELGQPHREDGPAFVTADGYEVYALHGNWVSRIVVMEPHQLRLQDIEFETELADRDLLIERYGFARYIRDAGAIVWHKDEFGELLWKAQNWFEPLVAVRVRNSRRESDGSFKEYVLRVPPEISTAKAAVAWTFGMHEDDYQPTLET